MIEEDDDQNILGTVLCFNFNTTSERINYRYLYNGVYKGAVLFQPLDFFNSNTFNS